MIGRLLALGGTLGLGSLTRAAHAEPADSGRRLAWSFRRPGGWEYTGSAAVAVAAILPRAVRALPWRFRWVSCV